ncbi:MAG TPA: hypothetical protein VLC07_00950, partial [Solirubrobacterales bacterium]|nr:hypothetical protein [Solirubrobacterales bacterium]
MPPSSNPQGGKEVPEEAVEAAGHVLETCEEERVKALLHARPGEASYPVDRRIDARKALAVAAPLITQPLSERLKEVERQRGEAEALNREIRAEAEKAWERVQKAEAALAEREEQVGKELEALVEQEINAWPRDSVVGDYQLGFDAGAQEVSKVIYAFFDRLTQPSSNPPQQTSAREKHEGDRGRPDDSPGHVEGQEGAEGSRIGRPSNPPQQDREVGEFLELKERLFSEDARKAALDAGLKVRDDLHRKALAGGPWKLDHEDIVDAILTAAWNAATGHDDFALTQPEADPEVPRCEWPSGETEPKRFHVCERCGYTLLEENGAGEDQPCEGVCLDEDGIEDQPTVLVLVVPADCQPTTELLGEEAKETIQFLPWGSKRWRIWNFDATRSGVEGPETLPPDGAPQQGLKATEEAPVEVMAVAEHEAILRHAEREIKRILASTQPVSELPGDRGEDEDQNLPKDLSEATDRLLEV